ncbi:odorant receptor 131-2-like, partial [Ranitomeya variabilis]|uniref:odorant receptor 131-2-like n=1 Tax=Ranitomeya variabilis TaxID=490064 RepID=UPI00405638DD
EKVGFNIRTGFLPPFSLMINKYLNHLSSYIRGCSVMVNSSISALALKIALFNSNILYLSLLTLLLVSFILFLCFMVIMLSVYFTTSHMHEEPRYILFAHMLISDTIYTSTGLLLFFSMIYLVYFPVPICYIAVTITSLAFKIAPYNLAVMSLERYVAICFPLRHTDWCTRQKTIVTIVAIWVIGIMPNLADFMILCLYVKNDYFSLYCLCTKSEFMKIEAQSTLRSVIQGLSFSLVGLVIIFTYIKIMLVAKKINSGNSVASKAGKTVMLHAVQLLLSLTSFSYNLTETYLRQFFFMLPLINFFFFMCLPRFISPLIYGFRDETFLKYIKRIVLCKHLRTFINLRTS